MKALRVLRWPAALIATCIALAVFVYFLMPDNMELNSDTNGTYWESVAAEAGLRSQAGQNRTPGNNEGMNKLGIKTSEIDFYDTENSRNIDLTLTDSLSATNSKRKLPISPVFPTHLTPEVQYGNEKADSENRKPKLLEETTHDDSTLKPHITQKPEKPLAIYFKEDDTTTASTETITRAETINDFANYDQKQTNKKVEEFPAKTHPSAYKEYVVPAPKEFLTQSGHDVYRNYEINPEPAYPPEAQDTFNRNPAGVDVSFTSGHSKLFGISIEHAEKMKSTTQSSIYNTRVSPTLPTWRDGDDTTTKKYPINTYSEVQCRSTRMSLCRGVLPYDLAGAAVKVRDVEITSLMAQIDYLVATNCSDRVRHFVCALLEPECSPPPYSPKKPCYNLCKAIVDNCDGHIPRELTPAFNCKQYSASNCVAARTPCYSREFTCGDGSCIPRDWICDGRNDCSAGEDEAKCVQCEPTDFKCSSGGCVLKRWLCDGYADCPEGEDESESICGDRHVQVPADRQSELGEESAGSAPAPAVRRPNNVSSGHRKRNDHSRRGENDSSKELLVTSDSNNAYSSMRNFTPSPSRLKPYNRTSTRVFPSAGRKHKHVETTEVNSVTKPTVNILEHESMEDVNMGDLGFFDEFDKNGKTAPQNIPSKTRPAYGVPAPNPAREQPEASTGAPAEPPVNRLSKAGNQFEKVIDGAALLRKASAAEAAEAAAAEKEDAIEANNTKIDNDDFPSADYAAGKQGWGRAHASPCPSGELRCVDGLCITLAQLCDGTIDCSDQADEDNCYT